MLTYEKIFCNGFMLKMWKKVMFLVIIRKRARIKMEEEILLNIKEEEVKGEPGKPLEKAPSEKNIESTQKNKKDKLWLIFLIFGILGIIVGLGCILFVFLKPIDEKVTLIFPKIPSKSHEEEIYSSLTGEKIANEELKTAPAFCIQVPNGTDGARPQSGLNEAGVIFEAIAEAGITRFAAIFQNPSTAIIGPIRSLRLYYLEWDTPFDCTIVHAGGAYDALAALSSGGYKDLTENYSYMYRGTYGSRLWNNLFTTSNLLKQFSADRGYNTSEINGFSRMTPDESKRARINALISEKLEITTPTTADTSEMNAKVASIGLGFGGWANFNVNYNYDMSSNTYLRSYESGALHEVYDCPSENLGEQNPEDVCSLTQIAPSVVVAMVVSERKASDNYHEDITTIGSGDAYIFQNGSVERGTWNKASRNEQIKFLDTEGNEILLAPGQTFVSAVPNYGSIDF